MAYRTLIQIPQADSPLRPPQMIFGGEHWSYSQVAKSANVTISEESGAGNFETGVQSLKIAVPASQTGETVTITLPATVNVRALRLRFKAVGVANLSAFSVRAHSAANDYRYARVMTSTGALFDDRSGLYLQEGVWFAFARSHVGFQLSSGSPAAWDAAHPTFPLTKIVLVISTNAGEGGFTLYLDRIVAPDEPKASILLCTDVVLAGAREIVWPDFAARNWGITGFPWAANVGSGDPEPTWAQLIALQAATPRGALGMFGSNSTTAFSTASSAADHLAAHGRNLQKLRSNGLAGLAPFVSWHSWQGYAASGVNVQAILESVGILGSACHSQNATLRPGFTDAAVSWEIEFMFDAPFNVLGPFNCTGTTICDNSYTATMAAIASTVAAGGTEAIFMHNVLKTVINPAADLSVANWQTALAALDAYVAAGQLELLNFQEWFDRSYGRKGDVYVDRTLNTWKSRSTGLVLPW